MSQPLIQRMNYHPDLRQGVTKSDRKVQGRLNLIKANVDFTDKVVWDLGCSGGFFAFSLASMAKKIIAIDGDQEIIERNRQIQQELNITNIEFIYAPLNIQLLNTLEQPDITLFLSVFHHIMAVSEVYDCNSDATIESASDLIEMIKKYSNTLVFEIGYPNEGCDWCPKLPNYGNNWDDYVVREIFKEEYGSVGVVKPHQQSNWVNRKIISKLSSDYQEDSLLIRRIKKLFKYDARDCRNIYVGCR